MSDSLQHLSTSELEQRFRSSDSSEDAARIAAELEQRTRHLAAAERANAAYGELAPRSRELATRRLIAWHTCGARVAPTDLGVVHAPIAERVTVRAVPRRGFIELRGWLVGSRADVSGTAGALSLVKLLGQPVPLVVGTHETQLGWAQ